MAKIKGGYYLKARKIQNSTIAHASPCAREVWDWLIKEANHKNKEVSGTMIERGQLLRSYKNIQEGLHWKVGYRKEVYSKEQIKKALRFITKTTTKTPMATTTKTTRGMLITILNYDTYQTPKNYEDHNEDHKKAPTKHPTINKNERMKELSNPPYPPWLNAELWFDFEENRKQLKAPMTEKAEKMNLNKLSKFRDAGQDVDRVLEQSIENGWKGLFELKTNFVNKNANPVTEEKYI